MNEVDATRKVIEEGCEAVIETANNLQRCYIYRDKKTAVLKQISAAKQLLIVANKLKNMANKLESSDFYIPI